MTTDSPPVSGFSPDQLFSRACAAMLGLMAAVVLGSHLVLGAYLDRREAEARLVMEMSEEPAALRAVMTRVEQMAAVEDAGARAALRAGVATDLVAIAARLEARAGRAADLPNGQSETLAPGLEAALARARATADAEPFGAAEAIVFKARFAGEVLPYADLIDHRAAIALAASRQSLELALLASALVGLIGLAALGLAVALPARRRIRDWVARTSEADQDNRFRLLHDPLTRMPNATYLHAYLSRKAAAAARCPTQTAVIRVDLDRFDVIHETLGPRTSDEIIRIVARRIQQILRGGDFAAHLGHDDFVVVAGDLEDENAAANIAQRIQLALENPFSVRGGAQRLGASLGVTLISDDEADADRILFNAERALSDAQSTGRGGISYFRQGLREAVERRELLYTELLAGLEKGELAPHFQPQIDLRTGLLAGFEALVRWEHPTRGLLAPAAFLDLADETELTERIGEVVLARSLGAINAWDAAGFKVPRVGINFALAQLRNPRLIEKIKWEVERFDVEPARIAVEVLETVLIKSDADMVVRNLRGLASSGFHIELDDFGTGHASISNLRRFMVDRIKIDRCFIADIENSEEQRQLTASMIAMANALGIATLAEGVETEGAELALRALGCDQFQGYLVARPMSAADTFGWLRAFPGRGYEAAARAAAGDPNTP